LVAVIWQQWSLPFCSEIAFFDCAVLLILSCFFCEVLISRNYRGDIPMNSIDAFPKLLMEQEEVSIYFTHCILLSIKVFTVGETRLNSVTQLNWSTRHNRVQLGSN